MGCELKGSLIVKYLPADYVDVYSQEVECGRAMIPDEFRDVAFSRLPWWIDALMRLRNLIVKPLGLDTNGRFTDMVCDRNSGEIIFGMPDKHLTFHVSMWCGEWQDGRQVLRIITVVRYNNALGRVYFFFIRPFHCLIVRSVLNGVVARRGD